MHSDINHLPPSPGTHSAILGPNGSLCVPLPSYDFTCDGAERLDKTVKKFKPIEAQDASVLPPEKIKAIQAEFLRLKQKYPKWKKARALRKAAEKYHVKIVDNGL